MIQSINLYITNLTNYIVEEKTTNLGTYRKWSNGTLEMWGRQELTECHLNIVNGSIVLSNGYTIQLPYTSVSIITGVSLCFRSTGAILVSESTGGNGKDTIGFWLVGGVQTRVSGGLEFRCTGTWK